MYDRFESAVDDTRYVLVEAWESPSALETHGKSPGTAEMEKVAPA